MPPAVDDLVHSVLRQPVKVVVGEKNAAADTVEQSLVVCGREDGKLVALRQMVREGLRPPVLIFMQSVERAMQLFHALVYGGLHVDVLHAERTAAQRTAAQREATVSKFRAGQVLPGRRLDADWMLKLKPMAKDERRRRAVAPIARKPIEPRPRLRRGAGRL